jgi:hypothetical protein
MLTPHQVFKVVISMLFVIFSTISIGNTWAEDSPEAMNHTPNAVNDTAETTLNTPVPIAILDNDSDLDNDLLEIIGYTDPTHGFVEQQGNRFVYTPNENFIGTDTFDYTISDGYLTETTATATSTAIAVLAPEGDFTDTDTFTFTINDNEGGEAIADANGTATIFRDVDNTPNSTENTESITFTISNALDGEAVATATAIAIASTEDAIATATATAIAIHTPTEDFTDSETFIYTLTSTNNSETSAITETVAEIIYTPSENNFSYTVRNSNGETVTATTIAIAIATASATITALTADTATVNINVQPEKPTVTLAATRYTTTSNAGTIQVADWITQATDGRGGTQLPHGGDNLEPIYFYVTSNSNPALFSERPWLSHPSHSLHFTTEGETQGSAEICIKAVTKKGHGLSSEIQCFTIIITNITDPYQQPAFVLATTNYTTSSDAGTVHVPAWITRAMDGMGGTQLPNGGDNLEPIYFYVTSNSNPALFSEQPWLSHPSHSLHFKTQADTHGSAEICVKAVTEKGHGISSEIQCFTIMTTETSIELPIETETIADSNSPNSTNNTQPDNTAANPPTIITSATPAPIAAVNTEVLPVNDDNKTITETENTKGAGGSFNIALLILLLGLGFFHRKNRQNITSICLSDASNKISTNSINNR